jgi:PST family polysaccharide transporter
MSGVIYSLAEMFKDFGLTSALLRKGHVDDDEVTFLFWFNVATTIILAAIIAALAPSAGLFFHEPEVKWVILVSLSGFVASGFALQHRAVMNRELKFPQIAAIDTVGLIVQFALTVWIAAIWHNVWAIVIGNVLNAVVGALLNVVVSGWLPGPPKLVKEAKSILKFGLNTTVYSLAVFISTNAMSILVGRFSGPSQLGQYNRANAILALPLNNAVEPIAQATLPVLARLRPTPDRYRRAYLQFIERLHLIVVPAAVVLGLASQPLVAAILGPKWAEAGVLLQCLSPVVACLGFGYAAGDLFISQDRSAELRSIGACEAVLRVSAVAIGLRFGVAGGAIGYSAATVVAVFGRVMVAGRCGPITRTDHLHSLRPTLALSLGVGVGTELSLTLSDALGFSPLLEAIAIGVIGSGLGLAVGLAERHSRTALLELGAMFRVPGSAAALRRFGHERNI